MKRSLLLAVLAGTLAPAAHADELIQDDLAAQGSACVGFDCTANENFSFDTIRLKENNLRIRFEDTSSSASFPSTDWQLTANDDTNGGRNRFSIEDVSNDLEIFTLMGGAPTYSVFVDGNGQVGFGTDTPQRTLHVSTGDNPTLRLEQNASGGFAATTWDIGVTGNGLTIARDGTPLLGIDNSGNLSVAGTVTSNAVGGDFPDYVFAPDYALMPLDELAVFVERNRHLPGIPPAREVAREGLDMTSLQVKLLEKVEELTRYTVRQQERIEALEARLRAVR